MRWRKFSLLSLMTIGFAYTIFIVKILKKEFSNFFLFECIFAYPCVKDNAERSTNPLPLLPRHPHFLALVLSG
jgi:hypothetical protein